ncbi:MAG: hypothetical protein GY927_13330 [bacterium]|nr:hypothetical protein [bacterium]
MSSFPTLPSLLTGHALLLEEDSFETACKLAAKQKADAGDIFWRIDDFHVNLAIVLEPEDKSTKACQILPVALDALGNSVATLAPPKVAITYDWPNQIRANGAKVAVARCAISTTDVDKIPDKLVIGFSIRLLHDPADKEPGENPEFTTLGEEGCPELTSNDLIESLCRHLLAAINGWQNDGLASYQRMWGLRIEPANDARQFELNGEMITGKPTGIDDSGNLLIELPSGRTKTLFLVNQFKLLDDIS